MATTPKNGEWISGRQYWNGVYGAPGVIMDPSAVGYGKAVSSEVNKQSDAAQGKAPGSIDAYLAGLSGNNTTQSSPNIYAGLNGGSGPGMSMGATPRTDFVNKQIDQFKIDDAAKAAKSAEAIKQLQDYYAGLESATNRFNRINNEQGVGDQTNLVNDITKNVMSTEDLISGLEPSVNQRSGNFLMNEGERTAVLARERAPLQDNLTKLLRSKQYEEVGLAGKQQLVSQLLQLSYKDDEMRAKPLELGVDFTEKDRQTATDLFKSLLSASSSAYSGDVSASEDAAKATADRLAAIDMENLKTANEIKVKQTPGAASSTEGKAAISQKAEDVFNSFSAGSKSEYDVWKKIDAASKSGQYSPEVINKLWSLHAALAAKTGTGGDIRSEQL